MSRFDPHTPVSAVERSQARRQRRPRALSVNAAAGCTWHAAMSNQCNAGPNNAHLRNVAATQRSLLATRLRIGQSGREQLYSLSTVMRAPINTRRGDTAAATRPFAA
ncbi:hypothetical protein KCU57_09910 [Xanthomonas translucens]|uniref:hypothetical protein n=1 Tax=Xanthomonas campestris pv. translucens TaxID=343 RepID=UPI001F3DB84D|nr:hypothetical protein [Xanthomonas translucens]UKE49141.1 hypothetical protein KCU57_09910 [Xanthomonas translucens]